MSTRRNEPPSKRPGAGTRCKLAKRGRTTPKGNTLIVISCSARKRDLGRAAPAEEIYDGVFYQVLRKARREGRISDLVDVLILSAKYGVIQPCTRIAYYDQRMTRERAIQLAPLVGKQMRRFLREGSYRHIRINVGAGYALAMSGMPELVSAEWAAGGIGQRAALLKEWLHS